MHWKQLIHSWVTGAVQEESKRYTQSALQTWGVSQRGSMLMKDAKSLVLKALESHM
jgi:hypothetical protein